MQGAFGYVLLGVVAVGVIAAVVSLVGAGRLYDQIGRGELSIGDDRPPAPEPDGLASEAERNLEIRRLLEARNARRAARGEGEQDVESALAELTRPRVDPALRAEIRELVVARNRRRAAHGREPLDVDAEVERQISQLCG